MSENSLPRTIARIAAMSVFLGILFLKVLWIFPVRGDSMEPFLRDGDLAVVYRLGGEWKTGSVIACRKGEKVWTGRVAGCPGDTVTVNADGTILVNGYMPVLPGSGEGADTGLPAGISPRNMILAEDEYYLLCDNASVYEDSRKYGPVKEEEILGHIICLYRCRIP